MSDDSRGHILKLRIDSATLQRFKVAAEAAGKPLSEWVRDVCGHAVATPNEAVPVVATNDPTFVATPCEAVATNSVTAPEKQAAVAKPAVATRGIVCDRFDTRFIWWADRPFHGSNDARLPFAVCPACGAPAAQHEVVCFNKRHAFLCPRPPGACPVCGRAAADHIRVEGVFACPGRPVPKWLVDGPLTAYLTYDKAMPQAKDAAPSNEPF